jgi:hypothetical protein
MTPIGESYSIIYFSSGSGEAGWISETTASEVPSFYSISGSVTAVMISGHTVIASINDLGYSSSLVVRISLLAYTISRWALSSAGGKSPPMNSSVFSEG